MTKEELIKILEGYEVFVDDDYGGSYRSVIAYAPDKKVSRAHTPIGTLKIIDTFEEIQNQNKKYKEVIDKAIEYINLIVLGETLNGEPVLFKEEAEGQYLLDVLKEVK